MRYRSTNTTLYPATYQLIRCPKYRRRVLAGRVEKRLKELIGEVAGDVGAEVGAGVIEIEVMADHVHRRVQIPPTVAQPRFVRPSKGRSARTVRSALPRLRRLASLWSPSWFVSTVPSYRAGGAPLEVVARSVENQNVQNQTRVA